MSDSQQSERLMRLLAAAFDSQEEPSGGHIVRDEDLLDRWSLDLLHDEEFESIVDHLAICPSCREDLTAMLRNGIIDLPTKETELDSPFDDISAEPDNDPERKHKQTPSRSVPAWFRWALATAACLLLLLGVWWFTSSGVESEVSKAEQELRSGDAAAALERLEKILDADLDNQTRTRVEELAAVAAEATASELLSDGNFDRVLAIANRITRRVGPLPNLFALKLQAIRRVPIEITLAKASETLLTSYGYEMDGSAPTKGGLPTFTPKVEKQLEEFRSATTTFPKDLALRLNFGQFLLTQANYEEAREQFEAAVRLNPKSGLAYLGLGLAQYELREYAAALSSFQDAVSIDPQSVAAHLNSAMCLERLGDPNGASIHWEKASQLTDESDLRKKITDHLSRD